MNGQVCMAYDSSSSPVESSAPVRLLATMLMRASRPGQPVPSSVEMLGEMCGLTTRVLQRRCQAAGVRARACLRFVQCLQLISRHESVATLLPVNDPRTIAAILNGAALGKTGACSIRQFIVHQRFITDSSIVAALLKAVELKVLDDAAPQESTRSISKVSIRSRETAHRGSRHAC